MIQSAHKLKGFDLNLFEMALNIFHSHSDVTGVYEMIRRYCYCVCLSIYLIQTGSIKPTY